jgi:hypothetical protein
MIKGKIPRMINIGKCNCIAAVGAKIYLELGVILSLMEIRDWNLTLRQ